MSLFLNFGLLFHHRNVSLQVWRSSKWENFSFLFNLSWSWPTLRFLPYAFACFDLVKCLLIEVVLEFGLCGFLGEEGKVLKDRREVNLITPYWWLWKWFYCLDFGNSKSRVLSIWFSMTVLFVCHLIYVPWYVCLVGKWFLNYMLKTITLIIGSK